MANGMSLSLDFTGVGEVLPEGEYTVELRSVKKGESSAGNPMLFFNYQVTDAGDYQGRTIFDGIPLIETTLWRLRLALIGLGFDPESVSGPVQLQVDDLVGRKTRVTVEHREWQGEKRANISRFTAIGAFEQLAADPDLAGVDAGELEKDLEDLFGDD
jgi:hypothetical protein